MGWRLRSLQSLGFGLLGGRLHYVAVHPVLEVLEAFFVETAVPVQQLALPSLRSEHGVTYELLHYLLLCPGNEAFGRVACYRQAILPAFRRQTDGNPQHIEIKVHSHAPIASRRQQMAEQVLKPDPDIGKVFPGSLEPLEMDVL